MSEMELIVAVMAGLAAFLLTVAAMLRAWNGWLELKRSQMASGDGSLRALPNPAQRIEVADLKERVRRLEAIANGVE
jgi:hypothetical protein